MAKNLSADQEIARRSCEATEITDEWLNLQFRRTPGLAYCITCETYTNDEHGKVPGHKLAHSIEEITSFEVLARLKGE